MLLSILESTRHKLRIADGFTHVTPYLHGWEAFPTPRALTHTKTLWPFDQRHHNAWVSFQSPPSTHGVLGTPHGEVRNRLIRFWDIFEFWQNYRFKFLSAQKTDRDPEIP